MMSVARGALAALSLSERDDSLSAPKSKARRVALLVGIDDQFPPSERTAFACDSPLPLARLPSKDVQRLSPILRAKGFSVSTLCNCTAAQILEKWTEILSIAEDSFVIFYFRGFGIRHAGDNFLLPYGINVSPSPSPDISSIGVSLSSLTAKLSAVQPRNGVFLLDYCIGSSSPPISDSCEGTSSVGGVFPMKNFVFATSAPPGGESLRWCHAEVRHSPFLHFLSEYAELADDDGKSVLDVLHEMRSRFLTETDVTRTPYVMSALLDVIPLKEKV